MSQGPQGGGPVALEWPGDVRDLPASGVAPWLVAFAVAAIVVVAIARRRRARPTSAPAPVVDAPEPTAAALLLALPAPADAAAFAAEVKRLVRLHAMERFGLAAFVATSEELQRALPRAAGLAPCLQACDAVLFAASALRSEAAARLHAHALAFAGGNGGEERAP